MVWILTTWLVILLHMCVCEREKEIDLNLKIRNDQFQLESLPKYIYTNKQTLNNLL
jgi:hypothetical protein